MKKEEGVTVYDPDEGEVRGDREEKVWKDARMRDRWWNGWGRRVKLYHPKL